MLLPDTHTSLSTLFFSNGDITLALVSKTSKSKPTTTITRNTIFTDAEVDDGHMKPRNCYQKFNVTNSGTSTTNRDISSTTTTPKLASIKRISNIHNNTNKNIATASIASGAITSNFRNFL